MRIRITFFDAYYTVLFALFGVSIGCGIAALMISIPARAAAPSKICLPAMRVDLWNADYRILDVPATVSTRYPSFVIWKGRPECGGAVQSTFYNAEEARDFLRNRFMGDGDVQAYRDKQPTTDITAEEWAWRRTMLYAWTPRAEVQHTTAPDTRPTYKLLSTGLRSTSAIAGVRVAGGSRCDINKRVATSSYYVVIGVDVTGKPLPPDAVAVCLVVDPWKL